MHSRKPASRRTGMRALGRFKTVGLVAAIGLTTCTGWSRAAVAEEPYRQFLERLRTERIYDLALVYLDDLAKSPTVDPEFVAEIPLERAILLEASASTMGHRSPQREAVLDQAKQAFQTFLDTHKNHPRRSEARLGLGNLLLTRAEEARAAGDPQEANPEAARYFGEAHELFQSAQKELAGILTEMQGARVEAGDEEKKALRTKYRDDYRRAELLAAFALENKGRSLKQGSPEWRAELEKALAEYTELYTHEKDRIEARNYALYYRSGIQRDLGKLDNAVDGYSRIVGIEGIDDLRPLQFKALTEIIKLWASPEQNKYPAALDLAAKWEKDIRPDERTTQDVIDFLVAASQAKIASANALQAKDPNDRAISKLRKDAREGLQKLVRVNGPHQPTVLEMMAGLGIAKERSAQPLTPPKVKNFEEAIKEASARIDQMQTDAIAQQTLLQSLDSATDEAQKKEIGDQLAEVNASIQNVRDQAAELLRVALRMFPEAGELSELTDTRYRLAFVELQRGNPWEAIAIGEFLAHTNAGSDTGLQCATVALAGYGKLITDGDAELQKSLTDQLQPFAEFMVQTWPNSSEAQAAASTLVQLAMNAGDFAKAQSYLDKLPAGTGKADKLRRDIGLVLAGQYFQEKSQLADGTPLPAELKAKRDSAIEQLTAAVQGLQKGELDSRFIEAINSLVRLQLAAGQVDQAAQWMNNPELSPVHAIRANPDLVTERLVKLDTYRTALQATVSRLGAGGSGDDALKEIEQLIEDLSNAAGTDDQGQKLLTSIFVNIARDLQDLVEGADTPEKKQKLSDGMVLLAKQVANNSDEFTTKFWAGQTLSKVAAALDNSARQTKASLQRESMQILQEILNKEAQSPGWIKTERGDLLVRITLARNLRQAGQYQQAIEQLAKVLAINPATLDLQIEAAEIYQAWGDSGEADKYILAMYGALPDGKGGKLVWGWGKLSQALAGKTNLAEQFFLTRYQLAVCQYRIAMAEKDTKKRAAELAKAERWVNSTVLLYPDLGGDASFERFDVLAKNIQKELGRETVGLRKK